MIYDDEDEIDKQLEEEVLIPLRSVISIDGRNNPIGKIGINNVVNEVCQEVHQYNVKKEPIWNHAIESIVLQYHFHFGAIELINYFEMRF